MLLILHFSNNIDIADHLVIPCIIVSWNKTQYFHMTYKITIAQ